MKFVRVTRGRFTFSLAGGEKHLLFELLQMYPLVPETHGQLSRNGQWPARDEDQRLLEESLATQRAENRRRILAMLKARRRFRKQKQNNRLHLSLTSEETNWLLEVLNDIRVGAWLALGEPEELLMPMIEGANARYLFAMEVASMFQSALLNAFGIRERMEWGGGSAADSAE